MPTTSAGARGADPFEQARLAARELGRQTGSDRHDVLVVLGTGLAPAAGLLGADGAPIDLSGLPWFPRYTAIGHRPEAWSIAIGSQRVLLVAGRLHLYEGLTPTEVVHPVRTAIAAGCTTAILTCSAGGINPALAVGDVVGVRDHLNLTGASPLTGVPAEHPTGSPYVDLTDAWSDTLRESAQSADPALADGVYAQVAGPHLETPAEVRMLAAMGADMVGMSLALEAIACRHLGTDVLGLAVVANPAAGTSPGTLSVADITAAADGAAARLAKVVTGVVSRLASG
jgi:purine-nucleoside phosphorylase